MTIQPFTDAMSRATGCFRRRIFRGLSSATAFGRLFSRCRRFHLNRGRQSLGRVTGLGIKVRSVPDISDIVDGRYIVNQIREIEIDELLGRSFVPPDKSLLETALTGKTIMVTGAGGSIGSELCRLIATWKPAKLVLFEASEYALYRIEQEIERSEQYRDHTDSGLGY